MAKDNRTFVFNVSWAEVLRGYPAEVRLEVYDAIIEYAQSGTLPQLKPIGNMAFSFIKNEIDYNAERYNETCEKRKEAGKRGAGNRWQKPQEVAKMANDSKNSKSYQKWQKVANMAYNDNDIDIYPPYNIPPYGVEIGVWRDEFAGSPDFETVCMSLHCPTDTLNILLKEFCDDQLGAGNVTNDRKEYRKHFFNWAKIRLKDYEQKQPDPEPKYYRKL